MDIDFVHLCTFKLDFESLHRKNALKFPKISVFHNHMSSPFQMYNYPGSGAPAGLEQQSESLQHGIPSFNPQIHPQLQPYQQYQAYVPPHQMMPSLPPVGHQMGYGHLLVAHLGHNLQSALREAENPPILYAPNIRIPIEHHSPFGQYGGYFGPGQPFPMSQVFSGPGIMSSAGHGGFPYSHEVPSGPPLGPPISSSEGDRESQSHFAPVQTKKNARPRIHKLNKADSRRGGRRVRQKLQFRNYVGEVALDDLYDHFLTFLGISKAGQVKASFQLRVRGPLEGHLLDRFVNSLSRTIDIFLPDPVFRAIVPELALHDETGMMLDAILCFSALMAHRESPELVDRAIPIRYYHQSIKSIRFYLSLQEIDAHENGLIARCLVSTMLLCVYELLFLAADSTYVKGAAGILTSILTRHRDGGAALKLPFLASCFWGMFECDLVLSLKYNLPSMYSVDHFWSPLAPDFFGGFVEPCNPVPDPDMPDQTLLRHSTVFWLHKLLINYATVNEYNNGVWVQSQAEFESGKAWAEWTALKQRLDAFESNMPLDLKPTIYRPSSASRTFPIVFFKDERAAIICLNYKLARISLFLALLRKPNPRDPAVQQEKSWYPANYARKLSKDIMGIMKTYDSNTSIWSVNVHTVRQVAHHLADDADAMKGVEELVERMIEVCHLKFKDKKIL